MVAPAGLVVGRGGVGGVCADGGAGLRVAVIAGSAGGGLPFGGGDGLRLQVYDQPQLSGDFAIDDSGMIDMPLLGLVPAAGLTSAGLGRAIGAALQDKKLILAPSVAVEVAKYRPFYTLGEVNNPGQYPYRPDMTVLTAISIAGGFTYRAEQDYVGVTRDIGKGPVQYRAPTTALAAPGDVITVFERRF